MLLLVSSLTYSQIELNVRFESKKEVTIVQLGEVNRTKKINQKKFVVNLTPLSENVIIFEQDGIKRRIFINTGPDEFTFNYHLTFSEETTKIIFWEDDMNQYSVYTLNDHESQSLNLY